MKKYSVHRPQAAGAAGAFTNYPGVRCDLQLPPIVPPYSKLGVKVSLAAAIDADAAAVVEGACGSVMSTTAGGAQPELGRQRAGDQRQVADEAGLQDRAEAGDAVGQHDAVDAVCTLPCSLRT